MNNKYTPAMPLITPDHVYYGFNKREAMAALAMQGILSNPKCNPDFDLSVRFAIRFADTLLDALESSDE